MKYQTKQIILMVSAVILAIAFFVIRNKAYENHIAVFIIVASLIVYCIFAFRWCRCPHCDCLLWRLPLFAKHCPHCGNELKE